MNLYTLKDAPQKGRSTEDNTTPEVRRLKQVWQIETSKKCEILRPEEKVSSDIYAIRPRAGAVPPRQHHRRNP